MSSHDAPPVRHATARTRLRAMLDAESRTARELSQLVGLSEREVLENLEHLARTLRSEGAVLHVVPARCTRCGFEFEATPRRARPSRCPSCKSERLMAARFRLD